MGTIRLPASNVEGAVGSDVIHFQPVTFGPDALTGARPASCADCRLFGRTAEYVRDVSAARIAGVTLPDLLGMVALRAMEAFDAAAMVIGLLDDETGEFSIQAAHGQQVAETVAALWALGAPALEHAFAARQPTWYQARQDGSATAGDAQAAQTVLAVPFFTKTFPQGGMLLYFDAAPQLYPADLVLLNVLADQATLAIEKARRNVTVEAVAVSSERNRIARDLHDSVTQSLFMISLISESLPMLWRDHPEEAAQKIEKLYPLAQNALSEMRSLLVELRSREKVDHDLSEQLRQLADRVSAYTDLQITTTTVGNCTLPPPVQSALYRTAQEALNNVHKHAKASRATVLLECQSTGGVMLRVADNGVGIDLTNITGSQLGLSIMRERAQEIGAQLTIRSQPGEGTHVVVTWQGS